MELDNYYKFVISTFVVAYFVGLIIALIYYFLGYTPVEEINYTNLFYMTGIINFKNLFNNILKNSLELILIPFSYLITSVKYGFSHAFLLVSPFLGQTKLLVHLIPQVFYFISYIIYSALGLKLVIYIITKIVNKIFSKSNKNIMLKVKTFNKKDIFLFYLSILFITIGSIFQVYLTKIFFIFFINFKLISYIFIIIFYIVSITISFYMIYKTIKALLRSLKNIPKYIIRK